MELSACIVVYNGCDEALRAAQTVLQYTRRHPLTLYLVDNASPDGSGARPVSYTHLDVYKRQSWVRPLGKGMRRASARRRSASSSVTPPAAIWRERAFTATTRPK